MRKPGGKNADGTPISVIAQEKVTKVNEDTLHLMTGQKKLKDEYKDPYKLPNINKSDIAGMMEAFKEYLRCILVW